MYCSKCGSKQNNSATFCSGCGVKLTHASQASPVSKKDPSKILKQGTFQLWKKKKFGFPEKGTLTLYSDRLEWEGVDDFTIPLDSIVDVSVESGLGANTLKISDEDDLPYTFQKTDKASFIAGLADLHLAAMMNKGGDLQAWRDLIDQLRLE